eukprot:TRINITY_DN18813_c0_g1_i1.p1 TRINITY_DN18813_c0_g1~~TRINITY_DN18813_c0_g1_i1.p1  ORF type:complete len:521 (-),score=90.37 TRINITY_DN18813_c0_g1_i1:33-1595(-)
MVEVEDPQLLQAAPRETWHVGSVLEVFSHSDNQWFVGAILQEDPGTILVLFGDNVNTMKQKPVGRQDPSLAVVGTHVRRAPPGWEVRHGTPPQLLNPSLQRQCCSLEEAWTVSFDILRMQMVQTIPRSAPAPGWHLPGSPVRGPPPMMSMLSPGPGSPQVHMTNGLSHQASPSEATVIPSSPGLVDVDEGMPVDHARLLEAVERAEEAEARAQQLAIELRTVREERDIAARELAEARQEIERLQQLHARGAGAPAACRHAVSLQGSPGSAAAPVRGADVAPPVPTSWQPALVAGAAGATSSEVGKAALTQLASASDAEMEDGHIPTSPAQEGVSAFRTIQPIATAPAVPVAAPPPAGSSCDGRARRRTAEQPVDIVVSVPRSVGYDEMEERRGPPPSRSLRSLAQNVPSGQVPANAVTRLPSAPVSALGHQHGAMASASPGPCRGYHQVSQQAVVSVHGGGMRMMGNMPAPGGQVPPSAPASLAAPPGGAQRMLPQRPTFVAPPMAPVPQQAMVGFPIMR